LPLINGDEHRFNRETQDQKLTAEAQRKLRTAKAELTGLTWFFIRVYFAQISGKRVWVVAPTAVHYVNFSSVLLGMSVRVSY
jgi:hypothetical protein